jgi:hypothetical protein
MSKLSHGNSPVQEEYAVGVGADPLVQAAVAEMDSEVDVVQHQGNDAEFTQKVDAGNALLCFLWCNRL